MDVQILPENLKVAEAYLKCQTIRDTALYLRISEEQVTDYLNKPDVKRFIDAVYLDQGYRNKFALGNLLDEIIQAKLEEARDIEHYTKYDLLDLLKFAHTLRVDESKSKITHQTNVQMNDYGPGNYGKLMERLIGASKET